MAPELDEAVRIKKRGRAAPFFIKTQRGPDNRDL
jgi:hypothetical protein